MLRRAGQLKQLLDNHRNLLASTVSTVSKIEKILAQSEALKGESMEEVDLIDKLSKRGFHGLVFCPIRLCTGALYGKINRMNIHFLKEEDIFCQLDLLGVSTDEALRLLNQANSYKVYLRDLLESTARIPLKEEMANEALMALESFFKDEAEKGEAVMTIREYTDIDGFEAFVQYGLTGGTVRSRGPPQTGFSREGMSE